MTTDGGTAPYDVAIADDEHVRVVRLTGGFDLRAAPELRAALTSLLGTSAAAATSRPAVFVEMSGLTFLDSTIISVLLMATKRAADSEGVVGLVAVPDHVRRVLDITGVSDVLVSYPTLEAAEESLSA